MSLTRADMLAVLALCPTGFTTKEIIARLGCASYSAQVMLSKLHAYGFIEKVKMQRPNHNKCFWRLPMKTPSIVAADEADALVERERV